MVVIFRHPTIQETCTLLSRSIVEHALVHYPSPTAPIHELPTLCLSSGQINATPMDLIPGYRATHHQTLLDCGEEHYEG